MLPDQEVVTKLAVSAYDAAAGELPWPSFLGGLAKVCSADSSALVTRDFDRGLHSLRASWNLHPDVDRLYERDYGALDVWAARARPIPSGHVCVSESLCPFGELVTTQIYNDFMKRYGIAHGLFAVAENDASGWASVSLYRELASGEFDESGLWIIKALVPHIQRAFKLHFQLSELKAYRGGVEEALNLLAWGVVFLGPAGEVLSMNKAAGELVNAKDGILFGAGRLGAAVRSESERLQAMIHGAVETGNGKGASAGGTMLISRRERRPLSVTVAPLRGFDGGISRQPAAVVFVSDPERNVELPETLLQRCYGLTRAEARLAMVLLEGCSLKEAADRCGVTHNTAKTELKIVFSKTQVKRQGELIRLLVGSAGLRLGRERSLGGTGWRTTVSAPYGN